MSKTPDILSADDMIAPGCGRPELLTRSPSRGRASPADLAPQPKRAGSLLSLERPSRIGRRLFYRDGRVTDLQGNAL